MMVADGLVVTMSIVVHDLNIMESTSSEDEEVSSGEEYVGRKGKRKRTTISKKPAPKPPNAFILYSLDNRPRIAEENKDLSNSEISRLLGLAWRKSHPDEKKRYKKKAEEMKEQQINENKRNEAAEHLAPLYLALYEANVGLNTLCGINQQ